MAKLIIKLINNVANVVNADQKIGERLKVAFLPNYRVTAMEVICHGISEPRPVDSHEHHQQLRKREVLH